MQAKTYIHLWDSKSVLFLQPTYKLDPSCGRWEHSHADYVLIFLLLQIQQLQRTTRGVFISPH